MRVVVDRFESDMAVLELPDGRTVLCGQDLLPDETREGDIFDITIIPRPEERERREEEVRDLQDRLKRRESQHRRNS